MIFLVFWPSSGEVTVSLAMLGLAVSLVTLSLAVSFVTLGFAVSLSTLGLARYSFDRSRCALSS